MTKPQKDRIVRLVNRKNWWHSPPEDPRAYEKRGQFLASTYDEAAFYGKPLLDPLKVTVESPLIGHETLIERQLFGKPIKITTKWSIRAIFALDRRRRNEALRKGYDSIVLLGPKAYRDYVGYGKIPRSIGLNLLHVPTHA
jgi:hypothetical protein